MGERLSFLSAEGRLAVLDWRDPRVAVLQERGDEHERAWLANVRCRFVELAKEAEGLNWNLARKHKRRAAIFPKLKRPRRRVSMLAVARFSFLVGFLTALVAPLAAVAEPAAPGSPAAEPAN